MDPALIVPFRLEKTKTTKRFEKAKERSFGRDRTLNSKAMASSFPA